MRTLLALLLVAAVAAAAPAAVRGADLHAQVRVNSNVLVEGPVILLGDLFAGIGDLGETELAKAPPPGRQVTLGARWLYRVARAYKLDWRPLDDNDVAVVRRDSQVVARADVEGAILSRLADLGAEGDMSVIMGNRLLRLHVAVDQVPSVAVDDIVYDPRSRRFTAVLRAPADDPAAPRVRASGRLQRMSEIPVPAHDIARGTVIRAEDLKWVKVQTRRLHDQVVADSADLIGKAPRRSLRRDHPVRQSEVQAPVLVAKRSLVTMHLEVGTMSLTARGKALDDGALGETVRVTNLQSNTVVQGVVTGPGRVAVKPPATVAMN
ncbi:MAG: flagellar basal body P-ring formation protein FlgA [Hyphomicrobiales bacterium]|nr:flagellar basal body P-ring formation protein FlgA [Hyphomicrobiales bacterium]MCP5373614.1 flagellar basal body P-ring formation protein FlgA [Hyphomicrobiales bacterium]